MAPSTFSPRSQAWAFCIKNHLDSISVQCTFCLQALERVPLTCCLDICFDDDGFVSCIYYHCADLQSHWKQLPVSIGSEEVDIIHQAQKSVGLFHSADSLSFNRLLIQSNHLFYMIIHMTLVSQQLCYPFAGLDLPLQMD